MGLLRTLEVKTVPASAGDARDAGLIPGSGRSFGGGQGNPVQDSCLENPLRQRSLAGYSPWGHRVRCDLAYPQQERTARPKEKVENVQVYISLSAWTVTLILIAL